MSLLKRALHPTRKRRAASPTRRNLDNSSPAFSIIIPLKPAGGEGRTCGFGYGSATHPQQAHSAFLRQPEERGVQLQSLLDGVQCLMAVRREAIAVNIDVRTGRGWLTGI